jgi:hypothetical protein
MVSKFMDKLKGSFNIVAEKLGKTNAQLALVIKENTDFLDAQSKLVKESTEAIESLKNYAANETPAIKDAFNSVSDALENIEKNRDALVAQMKDQFLKPMNGLIEGWKKLQVEIKEDNAAQGNKEKAKKDLEKSKAKPAEKLKPGEIEQAEAKLKSASEKADKEHDDVVKETATFGESKVKTLKSSLDKLVELQKDFYQKALALIEAPKSKVDAINVTKELDHSATQ